MKDTTAGKIADGILVAAGLGAAYLIVRTPPLRRLAWRLALTAVTGSIPAWLVHEVRTAWAGSGKRTERRIA